MAFRKFKCTDRSSQQIGDPYGNPTTTCPDFEPKNYIDPYPAQISGMVGQTLDAAGKPTNGTTCFFSKDIQYWFRDWKDSAKSDPFLRLAFEKNRIIFAPLLGGIALWPG